jgi:hypothetical protein
MIFEEYFDFYLEEPAEKEFKPFYEKTKTFFMERLPSAILILSECFKIGEEDALKWMKKILLEHNKRNPGEFGNNP